MDAGRTVGGVAKKLVALAALLMYYSRSTGMCLETGTSVISGNQRGLVPMAEHPNATVYRTALEKFNAGDMSATDLIADDVVWYQIGAEPLRGKEAMLQSMEGLEDLEFDIEIHDITASDDHVVGLITATVRTEDESFSYRTAEIAHVKDGKITERWAFSDDTDAIIRFFERLG